MRLTVLDTTLRDGAQAEGVSYSLQDKLDILSLLDDFGVDYIEAGQPTNPKDAELFSRRPALKNARLTAFGATARKHAKPDDDDGMRALLAAGTEHVTIVGKASLPHAARVLECAPEENLRMIERSCAYLTENGREVIFDAEHFFDGCKAGQDYAMSCLKAAARGGASVVTLCDTNGGSFPDEIASAVRAAVGALELPVGIHTHNDAGMADANAVVAVLAGAEHVQGTLCGFGERCGNASLATVVAGLQGKRGYATGCRLSGLTRAARALAEISNVSLPFGQPYVGQSAFAHKAGMHIDGVRKLPSAFEHLPPEAVGNDRRFLTSEMAGRNQVLSFVRALRPDATKDSPDVEALAMLLKKKESIGFAFEGAEASFELLVRKQLGLYRPLFELLYFKTFSEQYGSSAGQATALIKLRVGGESRLSVGEGDGPVHALDSALRGALGDVFESARAIRLIDYKVRVINPQDATGAQVRVLITSTDGDRLWSTVGVSADIMQASWQALSDSVEYGLMCRERGRGGEDDR